jgi:hypothetical protein
MGIFNSNTNQINENNPDPTQGTNQLLLNQEDIESNIVVGQPKIKNTLAIKNPTFMEKSSLTIHKDIEDKNKYYIKLIYDSLVDFKLNILFNAKYLKTASSLFTYENLLSFNCEKGFKVKFEDKDCYIDISKVNFSKTGTEVYDIVIEMLPILNLENTNEVVGFYTLANINQEKLTNETTLYKVKATNQRLRAHDLIIEVNEIFNSMRESGECIICFEKISNTILLPCKHSCCSSCAHSLRMRSLGCPVCKQDVNDLLIIEITD